MVGVYVRICVRFSEVHWEAILGVGSWLRALPTSVRTPRLQAMLSRGQKKRAEALGDLWECAWGALAEVRGKPTDSVLGKRKQPEAWAVQLPLSVRPLGLLLPSTGSFYGSLNPCCSFASWLVLKEFLF